MRMDVKMDVAITHHGEQDGGMILVVRNQPLGTLVRNLVCVV